jgi:segregation and condensation protein B
MSIDEKLLKQIIEGALMAAGKPLTVKQLGELFKSEDDDVPDSDAIRAAIKEIEEGCEGLGYELKKVASGYRFQVIQDVSHWVSRLWDEKPQRYSRALLETLSLIAYRQPITRGDIENIRGVAVSSYIVKTLLEREWVKVVGHKDVPGRPAMYATTKEFLDYFNVKSLEELPALAEIRDLDTMNKELNLEGADVENAQQENAEQETTEELNNEAINSEESSLEGMSSEEISPELGEAEREEIALLEAEAEAEAEAEPDSIT